MCVCIERDIYIYTPTTPRIPHNIITLSDVLRQHSTPFFFVRGRGFLRVFVHIEASCARSQCAFVYVCWDTLLPCMLNNTGHDSVNSSYLAFLLVFVMCTHTYAHIYVRTRARLHTHIHTHSRTLSLTHTMCNAHTYAHAHAHAHAAR